MYESVFGAAEYGQLYGRAVCFLIVGLKKNVSNVRHMVPETKISKLLQNEIPKCITIFQFIECKICML